MSSAGSLRILGFAALAISLGGIANARPGNPERYPTQAESAGMGGIGVAFGTSTWDNPAGLGRVLRPGLSASISAYGVTREEVPNFVDGGGLHGSSTSTSIETFPASLQYAMPLGTGGTLSHGIGISVIIPDWDQRDGTTTSKSGSSFRSVLSSEASESTTWILPAWGGCLRVGVCIGAGPTLALNKRSSRQHLTRYTSQGGDSNVLSYTDKTDATALGLGAQAGVQVAIGESLSFGLTVRSPLTKVYSSGGYFVSYAEVDSADPANDSSSQLDLDDPKVGYRMPARIAVGGAWHSAKLLVGADIRLALAQPEYETQAGPEGEAELAPTSEVNNTGPWRLRRTVKTEPTVNGNVGLKYQFTNKVAGLIGAFTDISSTAKSRIGAADSAQGDTLSRVGLTLGSGIRGEKATTWISLLGFHGAGDTFGYDDAGQLRITGVTSSTVLLMFGATANL